MVKLIPDPQVANWRPWDHLCALRLLFFLYRKPKAYQNQADGLKRKASQVLFALGLYLHALPWSVALIILGRAVVFNLGLNEETSTLLSLKHIAGGIAVGIAVGIARGIGAGIAFGIAAGIAGGIARGIAEGIAVGITIGIAEGIAFSIAEGIAFSIAVGIARGIARGIAFGIAFGIALGIAFGIAVGIAFGIALGIAVGIAATRAYYLPFHILLFRLPTRWRSRWYRYHPVAWDDLCGARFTGLSDLLVEVWQADPVFGHQEINRIAAYPYQKPEGLIALTTIQLRCATHIQRLAELKLDLPEGENDFLAQTPRVRELAHDIAHQARLLESANRPYMRQMYYELLMEKLNSFELSVKGMSHPLPREGAAAVQAWRALAEALRPNQRAQPGSIPAVFRAGEQLDLESDAFIHRLGLFGSLERQLSQAQGCPGLVLYGRRRVGKTTLLHNLPYFLPDTTLTLPFSMQDASFFTDLASFVGALSRCAQRLPVLAKAQPPTADLTGLLVLLGQWNQALGTKHRLLIIVDEYEKIDHKIKEGVFPTELLDTLRVSIQQHRQITWLFAGNHRIDELVAPWTSHLIACETLDVPFFALEETQLLLTDPLARSPHWSTRENRPRLTNFWAEGHIERLHRETGGWPYLVQLVAQKLVDQANDLGLSVTTDALMEQALDDSAKSAHNFLRELIVVETTEPQRHYLEAFLKQPEQPPHPDPTTQRALRRSELIIPSGPNFRLRAPLMARWMRDHL